MTPLRECSKPAQTVRLLCSGWLSTTLDIPRPESSLVILQASGTFLFYLHLIWFFETRSHAAKVDHELLEAGLVSILLPPHLHDRLATLDH